jgi:hypothetical protein
VPTTNLRNVKVSLLIRDLPKTAIVSGQATVTRGNDMRGESNGEDVVLEFDEEPLSQVLEKLQTTVFHKVTIDRIRF